MGVIKMRIFWEGCTGQINILGIDVEKKKLKLKFKYDVLVWINTCYRIINNADDYSSTSSMKTNLLNW